MDFDEEKIVSAIHKASQAVRAGDREEAIELAHKVTEDLERIYGEGSIPDVEDIQDIVEKVLIEEGRSTTAKAYIIYRQERRQKRREKEKLLNKDRVDTIDKRFSLKALRVLASRYLLRDEEGEIYESPKELFERVATTVTIPDIIRDEKVFDKSGNHDPDPKVGEYLQSFEDFHHDYQFADHSINKWAFKQMAELYQELHDKGQMTVGFPRFLELMDQGEFNEYESNWNRYFEMMTMQDFLPNSPTLMNAGARLGQLSACFVLPMEDDMGRIMDSSKDAALIFQSGGGVGVNYSQLRPEGDLVASTSGVASGPLSFMRIIDTVTDVVKQGGKRRGANMGVLNIRHPDIQEFIQIKEEEGKFENFNISVGIWSDFWQYLNESDSLYPLLNPRNGDVVEEVDAKQLLEMIAHSAWESADPGVIFFDRINEYNVLEPAKGKIDGTNPCGEQPLYDYESCNLGSINLHNFLEGSEFNWDRYEKTIRTATRFLDNVIDMNKFPIEKIEKSTKDTRKIGLGVMGLANLLYEEEIPYNSAKGFELMDKLAETLTYTAMDESTKLAQERGTFPVYEESDYTEGEIPVPGYYESKNLYCDWDKLIDHIQERGIRNGMHTTVAPTGSISMIGDTSNGIEPEFSLAYEKRVTAGDFYYTNNVLDKKLKERGIYSEELLEEISNNYGTLSGLDDIPDDLKRTFVTAMNIHYSDHLMAQAVWQKWITASISKTINLPNNATMEDVYRTYLLAHQMGLKGVTVYRDGSKSKQVLNAKGERIKKITSEPSSYIKQYLAENLKDPYLRKELEKLLPENGSFSDSLPEEDSQTETGGNDNGSGPENGPDFDPEGAGMQTLLNTGPSPEIEEIEDEDGEKCPSCGGKVVHEGGCNKCLECGWSVCKIS